MKQHKFPILMAGALLCMMHVIVMADVNEAPTPMQSFQQAVSADTNADQPQLAVVHTQVKSATNSTPPVVDQQSVTVLQAELTQLNQNTLLYQQKIDAQLEDLANKNQWMQQQLQQLTQALRLLNQELAQLKQMNEISHQTVKRDATVSSILTYTQQWLSGLQNKLGFTGLIIAGIIVILLLVALLLPRRKKVQRTKELDSTPIEYDYMGSQESIPAKLNLARAYIAMEDYAAARTVLDEVKQTGNQEQRQQADELYKLVPVQS